MSDESLPREISRGMLQVAPGLTIEVIVLDNGQRLITPESMEAFLAWLGAGNVIEGVL